MFGLKPTWGVVSTRGHRPPPPGMDSGDMDGAPVRADAAKEDAENKKQPPEAIALSGSISSWMTVSLRRGTRLMDITFQHEVPEVAKSLADAVTREYLAEIAGSKTEGRNNRSDTLIKQSEEARIKLQSVASALASYNRALESHKELDAQEALTAQLTHRYLPKHPKIIAALNELEALKKRFLREFDVAVASSADEAYWKTVRTQIDDAMAKPETHLQVARQLLLSRTGVLNGEANSQMSVFNAMLTRLEESRVNSEGEESNAEVSSLARISYTPVSPIPTKVYTSGAACGLTAGLFFAWLLIRMDNKYMSVAQVEAETGIPVLAAISDIDPRHVEKAINSAAKGRSVLPEPELQDGWAPRLVFRAGASTTNFAEMFRILRASITLLGDESTRKVTLFSSALPGEGKSLVSANFALAAAGQGRRTLLVDLDLRKPSIHHIFGFEHSREVPGISELLAGTTTFEKAIVRETGAENLHIIFSGGHATNPGELLNVSRVKQMLAEASKQYDVIVLDSAPLLAVPDTRVLADLADNFCLVVRSDYVPKGAVLRTLSLLSTAHTPVSGLIFNGYKERRRMLDENYSYGSYRLTRYGRPYQYGYGSYGTYGASDADDAKEIAARKKRKNRRKQK